MVVQEIVLFAEKASLKKKSRPISRLKRSRTTLFSFEELSEALILVKPEKLEQPNAAISPVLEAIGQGGNFRQVRPAGVRTVTMTQ